MRGRNLDRLSEDLRGLSALVTYNGQVFDLPKLRRELGIDIPCPHIDLLPCCRAAGWRGGLKECEQDFGIRRSQEGWLRGVGAVKLWSRYESTGDEQSLRRLVRYNALDALSLEFLAPRLYNLAMVSYPRPVGLAVLRAVDLDRLVAESGL